MNHPASWLDQTIWRDVDRSALVVRVVVEVVAGAVLIGCALIARGLA